MTDAKQYIVTRGGREVLRGDESDLLNSARTGLVLSNDLIYDSTVSQWSFARSLSILRGFPLRDRARTDDADDVGGSALQTGRRLLGRRRTIGRVLRTIGVMLFLTLLAGTLFLIPDSKKQSGKQKINNMLDLDQRAMKIEGSGSGMSDTENTRQGSSNMDSKKVVVDGEQDDELETDEEGRKAALLLTPEEMAALANNGAPGDGTNGASMAQPQEEQANANPEPSPSINAPPLPKSIAPNEPTVDQPLVLIRPKLDQLQRKVEELVKKTEDKAKTKKSHELSKELDRIGQTLGETEGQEAAAAGLKEIIAKIRTGLEESCESIESSDHCRLRIAHPYWSAVALSAVIRKDVILGMSKEQVELSIGSPTERRESGNEAVWCYDKDCEKRVEYRKGRVITFTEGIVRADTAIEKSDEDGPLTEDE